MKRYILSFITFIISQYSFATVWQVGSTQTYTMPSQINNLVQDGDTIYIDGGITIQRFLQLTNKTTCNY